MTSPTMTGRPWRRSDSQRGSRGLTIVSVDITSRRRLSRSRGTANPSRARDSGGAVGDDRAEATIGRRREIRRASGLDHYPCVEIAVRKFDRSNLRAAHFLRLRDRR